MKMMMAVVPRAEAQRVLRVLIRAGFAATFVESRGGMLRQAQYMVFIVLEEGREDEVLEIIRESCHSEVSVDKGEEATALPFSGEKAQVGGAIVFIWDIERVETL
jgi:uncharacterized protein YaaQ